MICWKSGEFSSFSIAGNSVDGERNGRHVES